MNRGLLMVRSFRFRPGARKKKRGHFACGNQKRDKERNLIRWEALVGARSFNWTDFSSWDVANRACSRNLSFPALERARSRARWLFGYFVGAKSVCFKKAAIIGVKGPSLQDTMGSVYTILGAKVPAHYVCGLLSNQVLDVFNGGGSNWQPYPSMLIRGNGY